MLVSSTAQSQNNRVVLGNPQQNDFSETLTYHNETVAFYSSGDYPKRLEIAIRNAVNTKVDVFICACTRFSPSLLSLFQQNRTAFFSKTVSVSNQQQVASNTSDAQILLNAI